MKTVQCFPVILQLLFSKITFSYIIRLITSDNILYCISCSYCFLHCLSVSQCHGLQGTGRNEGGKKEQKFQQSLSLYFYCCLADLRGSSSLSFLIETSSILLPWKWCYQLSTWEFVCQVVLAWIKWYLV